LRGAVKAKVDVLLTGANPNFPAAIKVLETAEIQDLGQIWKDTQAAGKAAAESMNAVFKVTTNL